jgi:hypothetical protein
VLARGSRIVVKLTARQRIDRANDDLKEAESVLEEAMVRRESAAREVDRAYAYWLRQSGGRRGLAQKYRPRPTRAGAR